MENKVIKKNRSFLGENVLLEDTNTEARNDPAFNFLLKLGSKKSYVIEQTQLMVANGKNLVDTKSISIWDYSIINIFPNGEYVVKITVKDHIVENKTAGMENFLNFSKLFNKPVEEVVLKLNKKGKLIEVISQNEIYNNWISLKNTELKDYLKDPSMQGIFIAGEQDFSNTLPIFQKNLLYTLFFDEVYDKNFENDNHSEINIPSKLFQTFNIYYDKVSESENSNANLKVKSNFQFGKRQDTSLLEYYQLNYKNIIKDDLNLTASVISNAEYSSNDGLLKNLHSVYEEKANKNLFFESIINIKEVK